MGKNKRIAQPKPKQSKAKGLVTHRILYLIRRNEISEFDIFEILIVAKYVVRYDKLTKKVGNPSTSGRYEGFDLLIAIFWRKTLKIL